MKKMVRSSLTLLLVLFSLLSVNAQVQHVSAQAFYNLVSKNDGVILDVRTAGEFSRGHIENATLISTSDPDFVKKVSLLSKDRPIYVYCLSGSRSNAAVNYLSRQGYTKLYNLARGTMDWQRAGYKLVKSENTVASASKSYSVDEFNKIIQAGNLTLVDFHAKWCAPCKKMIPIVEQAKSDFGSKVSVVKLDIEANESLKSKYSVQSIPGFVLFKNGKEVWRHAGMLTKEELYKTLKQHM